VRVKRSYAVRTNLFSSFCVGCCKGLVLFSLGIFILFAVPIIGWVMGPMAMFVSIFIPFAGMGEYKGSCPNCGKELRMLSVEACTCKYCQIRVLRDRDTFYVI